MTGPEHFLEAELLLERSHRDEEPWATMDVRQAQVHATLALAYYIANQNSDE